MKRVAVLMFVCLVLQANAEIYQTTDEDGNVVFTDQPPADAQSESVELNSTNVLPPVKVQGPSRSSAEEDDERAEPAPFISIVSPQPDTRVLPTMPGITISVKTNADLRSEHRIVYLLNGQPLAEPGSQKSMYVKLMKSHQGQRQIQAKVLARNGNVVAVSEPVTIIVLRPTGGGR